MATLKAAFLYWRLASFRIIGKALMALAVSLATTLNGTEWNEFTPSGKFIAVVTACGAMWLVVDAFLDQTLSNLQQHPEGLGIPGADVTRKTSVDSHQITTETVKP